MLGVKSLKGSYKLRFLISASYISLDGIIWEMFILRDIIFEALLKLNKRALQNAHVQNMKMFYNNVK